ncbi:MAG: DMT family transporter [Clostridia bacterium]|nr:DMT family transporter [Clostridia bacterium]
MVQLASIFNGLLNAFQNVLNAQLSGAYGLWAGTLMMFLAGLCVLLPMVALGKIKPFKGAPIVMYCGGLLGMLSVVCSNYAIGQAGATINLCLCLLGQIIAGAIVDQKGLLWMKKAPINPLKALSMVFIAVGAGVMILW